MKKIRTFIVDDSIFIRKFLEAELPRAVGQIEIIGTAINAADAKSKIPVLKPDVVTMDVEMPGLSGIEFLKQLMPLYPVPVVLVSSLDLKVFEALAAGAVDFCRKPTALDGPIAHQFLEELTGKILVASKSKVRPLSPPIPAAGSTVSAGTSPVRQSSGPSMQSPESSGPFRKSPLIALGASTGGTEATLEVIRQLPAHTPGIVIVQHMPPGFTKMYADRLNRLCPMEVKEAKNGDRIRQGLALIAPGDQHMQILPMGSDYVVRCYSGEKVSGHCPSVDVLFHSVARHAGRNSVGIILTGMGCDGADGLLAMKKSGAFTIGQDEASCVVYGMPMAAQQIGAVSQQAACGNIPYVLMNYLKK